MLSLLYKGRIPFRGGRRCALGLIAALALAGTASVAMAQTTTTTKVVWTSTGKPLRPDLGIRLLRRW